MTDFEKWLDALEQDLAQPGGSEERISVTDRLHYFWQTELALLRGVKLNEAREEASE